MPRMIQRMEATEPSFLPEYGQWDDSLFRTLIAATINGVVAFNEYANVEVYNDACEKLFQYERREVLGKTVVMLMPSPFREIFERCFHQSAPRRAYVARATHEVRGNRKDGTTFPLLLTIGQGQIDGRPIFVGIIQDLTSLERERAEREEEKALLGLIVNSSSDAIMSLSLDGVIRSWNPAAEQIYGFTADEIVGHSLSILLPPDRLHERFEVLARVRSGETIRHFDTVRVHRNGTLIDVSVTMSPIRDQAGMIVGASKTVRDVTERRVAEAHAQVLRDELSHVARVSEMSQVSAGLAHELKQPLSAILNYVNVIKRLTDGKDTSLMAKAHEAASKAGEQALRAGQIISRLREFVEKRESSRTVENINRIAEDALALGLLGTRADNIATRLEFASEPPPILVHRVQIQQVLVNLLRNAAEAMSASPKRELTVTTAAVDDYFVEVTVRDTGPGIAKEIADKLFKPFVTTKPDGMGVGLAISHAIIQSHGGELKMEPLEAGGTLFRFRLPTAPYVQRRDGTHEVPRGKPVITWCDEFSVGVRSIDGQHRHLVELVNQIHADLQAGCSQQDLEAGFLRLTAFATSHFRHEEELFHGGQYSGADAHSREHGNLLYLLSAYQQSLGHDDEGRIKDLLPRLRDWLLDHIKGHDMALGAYLNSIGID